MDDMDKFYFRFCRIFFACFLGLIVIIFFSSCTISMNMVSTEGVASDVIDEVQSPTNDVKADVSVPVCGV